MLELSYHLCVADRSRASVRNIMQLKIDGTGQGPACGLCLPSRHGTNFVRVRTESLERGGHDPIGDMKDERAIMYPGRFQRLIL